MKRALKRLFLAILSALCGARPCPPKTLGAISPARILVVATDDRMGELLLAGPLVRALAATFPASELHLLHAARFGWVAARLPGITRAVPFPKRDFFRRPAAFLAFMRGLRRARFALAVDAGKDDEFSFTAALLSRASGAPTRLTHDRGVTACYSLAVARGPAGLPEAARRVHLMTAFADRAFEATLRITTGRSAVTSVPFGAGAARRRVGIYAGARKHDHRLDPRVYAGVVTSLMAHRCDVLIVPGLDDAAICGAIAKETGARLAPLLEGDALVTSLAPLDLFIANNTGPMHLAVAAGVSTLGLFLKVDPGRWGHAWGPHRTLDFRDAPPDAALISRIAIDMLRSS